MAVPADGHAYNFRSTLETKDHLVFFFTYKTNMAVCLCIKLFALFSVQCSNCTMVFIVISSVKVCNINKRIKLENDSQNIIDICSLSTKLPANLYFHFLDGGGHLHKRLWPTG